MRNRLLLLLVALVTTTWIYALNVGDYVFAKNGRYRIIGDNLCTNGQFEDDFDGWEPVNSDFTCEQAFEKSEDAAIQGKTIKSISAGTVDQGIYQLIDGEPTASYVAIFKIRNANGTVTTNIANTYKNYVNFFANNMADVSVQATDSASGTIYVSSSAYLGVDKTWQTVAFGLDLSAYEDAMSLFVEFANMENDVEIGEVEVYQAVPVYDIRIAEKALARAQMIRGYDFFTHRDYIEDLDAVIEALQIGMEENPEDLESAVSDLNDVLAMYIEDNTEDYYVINFGEYDVANNSSANWTQWTSSWNRSGLTTSANKGGWKITGGNWGNRQDYDGDGNPDQIVGRPIWNAIGYGWAQDNPAVAARTFELPPGKWITEVEAFGGHYAGLGSQNLSYIITPRDTCYNFRMYAGDQTTETYLLSPEEYQTYTFIFDLAEKTTLDFGYEFTLVDGFDGTYNDTQAGNSVNLLNPTFRRVKDDNLEFTLVHEKAIIDTKANLTTLQGYIDTANKYYNDSQYAWGKAKLKEAIDNHQAKHDEWALLTDQELASLMDEGTDMSTVVYNQSIRIMRDSVNSPFIAKNEPVVDLAAALKSAKKMYDDPKNEGGDHAPLKAAIDAADAFYAYCFSDEQGHDWTQADSLGCRDQIDALAAAKKAFKMPISTADNPTEVDLVDNDFSKTTGSRGNLVSPGWNFTFDSTSTGAWSKGTWRGDGGTTTEDPCISFNRGYSAFSKNYVQQTITLTLPGYYTFAFEAYAYNCVESYDKLSFVYYRYWDPEAEEIVETDSVVDYVNCAKAFFGVNGLADSLTVHKNPKAANLAGISLYNALTSTSATYYGSCPPDYYQMTIYKEGNDSVEYELGISFLNNETCNNGGFGSAHIYYTAQDKPNNPVYVEEPEVDTILGDANDDGAVDVGDITTIASYILGNTPEAWNADNADANEDGAIDVGDITTTAGIILGN